jgi:transcriptional regulator with XRE-family HTH domain
MTDKSSKQPTEIDHQIGQRLRKWRLAQDVDACVLAQKLGVSYQQLQKYEKGQTRIAASRLYEIAQTLSVPVQWFFREESSQDSLPDPLGYRTSVDTANTEFNG